MVGVVPTANQEETLMIPAGTYTIEREHSELGFQVRHAGIA